MWQAGSVTPRPRGDGAVPRRLLPGEPVHRLAEAVDVAVVWRVLLDHVAKDPTQPRYRAVGPGRRVPPARPLGEPLFLDEGQVREHPAQGQEAHKGVALVDCQRRFRTALLVHVSHGR
jgi:hypothetical protein